MSTSQTLRAAGNASPSIEEMLMQVTAGRDALQAGASLNGYVVERVLSRDDVSIIYAVRDSADASPQVVEEYLPSMIAVRMDDGSVRPRTLTEVTPFAAGLRAFVDEGEHLTRLEHPSLLHVQRTWRAKGTAYRLVRWVEGVTLYRARHEMASPPDKAWLRSLMDPVLDALRVIHNSSLVHGDLRPGRILLSEGQPPVLLGFGAARAAIASHDPLLAPWPEREYVPLELTEAARGRARGPWTDLYSLAAVLRFAITGEPPAAADLRAEGVRTTPLSQLTAELRRVHPHCRYDESLLEAIDQSFTLDPRERPASVDEFMAKLKAPPPVRTPPAPDAVSIDIAKLMASVRDAPPEPPMVEPKVVDLPKRPAQSPATVGIPPSVFQAPSSEPVEVPQAKSPSPAAAQPPMAQDRSSMRAPRVEPSRPPEPRVELDLGPRAEPRMSWPPQGLQVEEGEFRHDGREAPSRPPKAAPEPAPPVVPFEFSLGRSGRAASARDDLWYVEGDTAAPAPASSKATKGPSPVRWLAGGVLILGVIGAGLAWQWQRSRLADEVLSVIAPAASVGAGSSRPVPETPPVQGDTAQPGAPVGDPPPTTSPRDLGAESPVALPQQAPTPQTQAALPSQQAPQLSPQAAVPARPQQTAPMVADVPPQPQQPAPPVAAVPTQPQAPQAQSTVQPQALPTRPAVAPATAGVEPDEAVPEGGSGQSAAAPAAPQARRPVAGADSRAAGGSAGARRPATSADAGDRETSTGRAASKVASSRADRSSRTAPVEPADPKSACSPRTNFALYRCMQVQCERPKYAGHVQCAVLHERDEVL